MQASIHKIIKLGDPINKVIDKWKRPNGLIIKRVSTSIGVIGIIYESRPNVTSDVSSLCFKSGNVIILRGGSEAYNSNMILVKLRMCWRVSISPQKLQLLACSFPMRFNRSFVGSRLLQKRNNQLFWSGVRPWILLKNQALGQVILLKLFSRFVWMRSEIPERGSRRWVVERSVSLLCHSLVDMERILSKPSSWIASLMWLKKLSV